MSFTSVFITFGAGYVCGVVITVISFFLVYRMRKPEASATAAEAREAALVAKNARLRALLIDDGAVVLGPEQRCPACHVKFQEVYDVDAHLARPPKKPTT